MGLFSYMCNGCNTSLRGPEKVVLKHIRHGEVLGVGTGSYDEYGGIEEDKTFRSDDKNDINSYDLIHKSEYDFPDSISYDKKIYKEKNVSWREFTEEYKKEHKKVYTSEMDELWGKLKKSPKITPARSGVEAWHKKCYNEADVEIKNKHIISESDPNQGLDKEREEFL